MKIIWSKKAKYNFYTIRNYLEHYWSPLIAEKFINDVLHINILLEKNPHLGKYRADLDCREILISKHITLYYQTNENNIRLIAFWNNRQQPADNLSL
jgi:plasmid stabilization system protein ParE